MGQQSSSCGAGKAGVRQFTRSRVMLGGSLVWFSLASSAGIRCPDAQRTMTASLIRNRPGATRLFAA